MEKHKSCTFFGHRNIVVTEKLKTELTRIITLKIEKENFCNFYFGGFGDFDDLCYKIVSGLKQKYKDIRRIFCLYDNRHVSFRKRPTWLKNEEYEDYVYLEPSFSGWYKRIYFRNIEMVNISDFIIFYVENSDNSASYKILKYAKSKNKNFLNLAKSDNN